MDIDLLQLPNAQQREEDEWSELFVAVIRDTVIWAQEILLGLSDSISKLKRTVSSMVLTPKA
jgi:hypothetical protein